MKDILNSVHAKQYHATSSNPAGAVRCVSPPPGFIGCVDMTGELQYRLPKRKVC